MEASDIYAATFTYSYDLLNGLTNAAYSDGSRESYSYDPSGNRLSRTTGAAAIQEDVTAPSVPSNLATNSPIASQLNISWTRASDTGGSGLAGYQIYVNDSLFATTTGTNYTLSSLSFDSPYCLYVVAFDRDNNVSAQSAEICFTMPTFEPPYLVPFGFANGHFQIGTIGGTEGPYNVWGSSNLLDWQWKATVWISLTNSYFTDPDSNIISPYFYRFGWRTNTP